MTTVANTNTTVDTNPLDQAVGDALHATVQLHQRLLDVEDRSHTDADRGRVQEARHALATVIETLRSVGAVALLVALLGGLTACGGPEASEHLCLDYVQCEVDVLVGCDDPSFGPDASSCRWSRRAVGSGWSAKLRTRWLSEERGGSGVVRTGDR